jgi:spore germination protein YaaH
MFLQHPPHIARALVLATALTVLASSTASASSPAPGAATTAVATATTPKLSREVFGFTYASSLTDPTVGYPSWNFDLLSTVAFFALYVNWDGNINTNSSSNVWNSSALTGLVNTAHAHGTKVVVTITLGDFDAGTRNMCAGLINRAKTIKQTVAQVTAKGVDGVNIDYESNNNTCPQNGLTSRSMMVQFAHDLRAALPHHYISIDTYASSANDPAGFFDIAGLSPYVDAFFVMAYDLAWSNYHRAPLSCSSFCLGPAAPLTGYYYNDTAIAAHYTAVVPASKVILGVPYYGNVACVSSATANAYPLTAVTSRSYLSAAKEASSASTKPGTYAIHRDANDAAGKSRWDTWYSTSLGCTRELYWDDATSLGAKYGLVNSARLRGVGIWTLNYGGGAKELWSALANHFAACRAVSASVSPASPQNVGAAITLSAHTTGCPSPVYRFSVLGPDGAGYQVLQEYSSASTFSWHTSGLTPGAWRISVWARGSDGTGVYGNDTGRWDAYNNGLTYTLKSCSAVSVSVSPASPAGIGAVVKLTAHATGCASPQYRFLVMPPGGTYQVAQDYSTIATFSWATTGLGPGQYRFSVWAKDTNSAGASGNSSGRWDAYNNGSTYTLMPVCSAVGVSAAPASPAAVGTTVSLTASATGCTHPVYHFAVLAPGATAYQVVQEYSATATFNWNTTGKALGDYRFSVWARDNGSTGTSGNSAGRWDTYNNNTVYRLTPTCSAVTVTVSPASPAHVGATVTLTAHATGCPNPQFHFSVIKPGGATYELVQDYSTNATLTWDTTGAATGFYRFSVWARDAASAGTSGNTGGRWDAYNNGTTFVLN